MERPVIVQYWHASPPQDVVELMETWRKAALEGFEYQRFDDEAALRFIRDNFDRRTVTAYLACAVPAMKADLFRICALLIRPGIYIDADMTRSVMKRKRWFLRDRPVPLSPLYRRLERGLLLKRDNRVANGFMIVKRPADMLLRTVLANALNNIEKRISNNVYQVTGPGIATQLLHVLGPDHEYFRGFEFWSPESLLPYMRMVGRLPYKQTDDHWVNAQNKRSIFVDLPA